MVGRVFVDTSALLTLLDRADPRHDATRAAFAELADAELVTHGYVIAETIAVTRRRFGVEGATSLIDDLLPVINLLAVEPALHAAAQAAYRASLPAGTSFVDQVSLHVISHEGITAAFALDPDLASPGVTLLPRDPIAAARGSLAGSGPTSDEVRETMRREERESENLRRKR